MQLITDSASKTTSTTRGRLLLGIIVFINISLLCWRETDGQLIGAKPSPRPNSALTLRACCGPNCEEFQRPEDMVGITCCGEHVSNQITEICCEGVPRRRRPNNDDRCCGNSTISFDQTCCNRIVHNIPNGECCGSLAYARNNINAMCCDDVLHLNVEQGQTCCGEYTFDGGIRETCCGGKVFLKDLFDGCCPVYGTEPAEFKQFNMKTHQCCDVPIAKISATKCCFLRNTKALVSASAALSSGGVQLRPTSYDTVNECCLFPFERITQKNAKGECVSPD